MPKLPTAITIGDQQRQEFANIVLWLRDRSQVVSCRTPREVDRSLVPHHTCPVLVVWLQSYAGEFSSVDLDHVCGQLCEIPMLCAYSAYGEGETRTGKPLVGVPRFPFYCWEARIDAAWPHVLNKQGLTDVTNRAKATQEVIRVGVYSASPEMNQVLCEGLGHRGYPTLAIDAKTRADGIDVIVWEDSRKPRSDVEGLESLLSRLKPRPAIAIEGFPRWQDAERLTQLGVKRLLGKPFNLSELTHAIDSVVVS